MTQLSDKHKKFVAEYIKTLDYETSALKAGFKKRNLTQLKKELLEKDFIIKEIKKQLKQQISSIHISRGYIVQKLLQIAEFSLEEEDILDKEGNFTGKRKLRDPSAGLKALEGLCKHLGIVPQAQEQQKKVKIITITNLDDNKI